MIVPVTVDRPLGSRHPVHKDMIYPVNYGYVPGIMAQDGEEQDAYILGIHQPLQQFTGKLAAIVHRRNDIEDKWIVIPEDAVLSPAEILSAIHFQEQYFEVELELFP